MLLRDRLASSQNLGVILSHLFIYEPLPYDATVRFPDDEIPRSMR
jgi:hypothetical protein